MSRGFPCWEKDPFFSAAEQVQDSADRLESAYRAWIHAKSQSSDALDGVSVEFFRREFSTAFGIAKWQLEEFEKEVSALDQEPNVEDDASQRHQEFVEAISNQLSSIKNALLSSKDERDLKVLSTVTVGGEESDKLAHFLCGSRVIAGDFVVDTPSNCTKADDGYKDITSSASLFSTSSGIDCRKVLSESLDECSSYQETRVSRDTNEHHVASEASISEGSPAVRHQVSINVGSNDSVTHSASELGDSHDSVGICVERAKANGHHRTTSIGGLSCCTERSTGHCQASSMGAALSYDNDSLGGCRAVPKHVMNVLPWNIWSLFLKTGCSVGSGVSQSVLKRWKDGEGDPLDFCQTCDGDMEANCSTFLCQDGKRMKGCSEVLQILRSSQKTVPGRQLLQRIIVVLAALGFLCLYLY